MPVDAPEERKSLQSIALCYCSLLFIENQKTSENHRKPVSPELNPPGTRRQRTSEQAVGAVQSQESNHFNDADRRIAQASNKNCAKPRNLSAALRVQGQEELTRGVVLTLRQHAGLRNGAHGRDSCVHCAVSAKHNDSQRGLLPLVEATEPGASEHPALNLAPRLRQH